MPKYMVVYTLKGDQKKYEWMQEVMLKVTRAKGPKGEKVTPGVATPLIQRVEDAVYIINVRSSRYSLKAIKDLFAAKLQAGDKLLVAGLNGRGDWSGYAGDLDNMLNRP
ncbi:MAG: hypothetical protein HY794_07325 [Desulfarculus sp.]|nr:hypothetical protein [Desulfarculus sp.]